MTFATFTDQYLLPEDKQQDRLSRLFVNLTVAAALASLAAATLTYLYGYEDFAVAILLGALTLPLTLPLLRITETAYLAGHYLAANLFLQTIFFAADPAIGCVVLIAVSAGVGLLPTLSSQVWIGLVIIRCVYVAVTSEAELPSATAAASALVSVFSYVMIRVIEKSRELASLRARTSTQQSNSQIAVLQRLISEHFDALLQIDDGHIAHVSPSLAKLLGYAPDDILTKSFAYFLHPDEKTADHLLSSAISVEREELRLRHADGRWVWVEAYIAPDLQHQRAQKRLIILRNYDQQKQASEQLVEAQRLDSMGTMAAAVAHDFNNMLTVILGFTDDLPEGIARREITRVATSAASLSNKLLTFGHGQLPKHEILDLSHVMREHSSLVRHALDSRYILIESYQEEPALVRIDSTQFEQVFLNLLNNARESMPKGGEVEISLYTTDLPETEVRAGGTYAVVELRDSGCGMDESTRKHVFDPFFSTKQGKKTTGLGLSSCYGIISQHGGFIEIDSAVDQGTTVSVFLPLTEANAREPVLELIDNDATIVIVDDDPGVLGVVRKALVRQGYQVRAFSEPESAMEFFDRANVCLLITDVIMPGINGADMVTSMRNVEPNLPVLFISGFTQEHLDNWQLGDTTMFLAKPFRAEEIIDRAESLLRAHLQTR